jgi:hypothetical protein
MARIKRVISTVLLTTTTACMGTYRVSPAEYVPQHNPTQMLIMDNTGSLHVLDGPVMKGDTLLGVESGTPDTLSVPINQVDDALVRHTSKGRTLALVGGLGVGVGLAVFAVATQGAGRPCQSAANKKDFQDPLGTNTCNTHAADGAN